MMQYIWGGETTPHANQAIGEFVSNITWGNTNGMFPGFTSLGVLKDGRLIGGVIYHDYKPGAGTIEISAGAVNPKWLSGPTLYLMHSTAFDLYKCRMIGTGNAGGNKRLHRQLRRLGYKEHVLDDYWAENEDCHFWTLTRKAYECNDLINRAKNVWINRYVS